MDKTSVNPIRHLRDIDWRQPSVIALVLANLVPVFGVLVLHWQVFPLMFLFWSENVIVGVFNVLKMLINQPRSISSWIGKLIVIPFFCFHYGLGLFVHGAFVVGMFGGGLRRTHGFPGVEDYWNIAVENGLVWAFLGLTVSRGVSFVTNYIGLREYERVDLGQLLFQPYARVMVLHFAILIGAFLVVALHSPTPALVLLIVLKIAVDLAGHVGERKKFAVVASTVPLVRHRTARRNEAPIT